MDVCGLMSYQLERARKTLSMARPAPGCHSDPLWLRTQVLPSRTSLKRCAASADRPTNCVNTCQQRDNWQALTNRCTPTKPNLSKFEVEDLQFVWGLTWLTWNTLEPRACGTKSKLLQKTLHEMVDLTKSNAGGSLAVCAANLVGKTKGWPSSYAYTC